MPRKILIVEDETVVLNFARAVLKSRGHEVMTAQSVAEARRVLPTAAGGGDLCLVVDVVLDSDSGIAFAQEVAEMQPRSRVLLMSGFTDDVLIGHPEQADRFRFLRKPFTREELVSAVESVCLA